jgi:adenine deaminase
MGGTSAEDIQRAVERAQRAGETFPSTASDQLYYDPDAPGGGEIVGYPEVVGRDPERITQVPQGQRWA